MFQILPRGEVLAKHLIVENNRVTAPQLAGGRYRRNQHNWPVSCMWADRGRRPAWLLPDRARRLSAFPAAALCQTSPTDFTDRFPARQRTGTAGRNAIQRGRHLSRS